MKKPPPFDIALRDSIQPLLPSPAASIPASESPLGGSSKTKTATKGTRLHGSKRKATQLVEDPMEEDIPATDSDIGDPRADPNSINPPRAPPLKRIHLAGQAKPINLSHLR